jgi:hypothetical protein
MPVPGVAFSPNSNEACFSYANWGIKTQGLSAQKKTGKNL